MTSSALTLALRIAQLLEENSEREIKAAVALLEKHGTESSLLAFAARRRAGAAEPKQRSNVDAVRELPENATSRAVLQLRETDPEKFRLLSEFDQMVRRAQVLANFEDVKRFGERISKDFHPRKSRKETIGPLLSILAERPLSELERLVEFAASFGVAGDTDEYQRLAQYLIKGKLGDAK